MTCSRGKATPDRTTTYRLFSDSAGFCQNPKCSRRLFVETATNIIHVAEQAHVFAAIDGGPRTNRGLSEAERGQYENIVLLCPNCHTIIDKAETEYPAELLVKWKTNCVSRISELFGAVLYTNRTEARAAIEPLLRENQAIHAALNPDLPYQANPEAEEASKWRQAVIGRIIPNNRRVLGVLDENREYLVEGELEILEQFRQHVLDQEIRHMTDVAPGDQQRFPTGMVAIMDNV